MDNVLLDRRSSGSFEFPRRGGGFRPGQLGRATPAMPRSAYSQQYKHLDKVGAWSHAPTLPYARPPLYSSPSLPLLPSNQPPLLPLPPTATKYATFPYRPPQQLQSPPRTGRAAAPAPSSRQSNRRRKPSRPPPTETTKAAQKKKPLERATPLPPVPVVTEALDDLEQEVARNFVQDLLHVLAPPPSSLPLPRFSLIVNASSSSPAASKVVSPPPAPSCNAEAAAADSLRRILRL
ncbi:hypothetical protein E2562_022178 [Oryza meyeriana var. granulata]|uniref:Uncharacterized protein n=1 Tax=Oryza meyeriana var. granulata TaxID=110450 RepID=A0A6G1DLS6_9ORYZ|nr:hypothetical protein E2562_022178 [Oryza meyeriana var. granulata]